MTKTYMRKYYPGIFVSETSDEVVTERVAPESPPKGCYAVQFFDQTEELIDGEKLLGKPKNWSKTTFYGTEYTDEEAIRETGEHSTLASNVRGNKYSRLVKTIRGNWQPLSDGDVVIKP